MKNILCHKSIAALWIHPGHIARIWIAVWISIFHIKKHHKIIPVDDIRTFGAVMTTFVKANLNCGQVRGPVQLGFANDHFQTYSKLPPTATPNPPLKIP